MAERWLGSRFGRIIEGRFPRRNTPQETAVVFHEPAHIPPAREVAGVLDMLGRRIRETMTINADAATADQNPPHLDPTAEVLTAFVKDAVTATSDAPIKPKTDLSVQEIADKMRLDPDLVGSMNIPPIITKRTSKDGEAMLHLNYPDELVKRVKATSDNPYAQQENDIPSARFD